MQLPFALILGGVLIGTLGFCLGASLTAYESGDDLNKFFLPFMSMVGTWVSGVGAFAAAFVALHIASRQATEQRIHATIKCVHHSMAVVNDLRSRVHYQREILSRGGVPLVALTTNASGIEKRYETLYDREIYQYLCGSLVDRITALAGSIFGLYAISIAVAAEMGNQPHAQIPPNFVLTEKQINDIKFLESELDGLFDALEVFRKKIEL